MKSLKLAAFALAFGIFAASCGGNTEETTPPVDSTVNAAPETPQEVAPATPAADTTVKPEVAPATPAADTTKK